jgi:uncharacterized protein
MPSIIRRSITALALFLIYLYRALSRAVFQGQCRHIPSCSEYAAEALQKYPLHTACVKIAKRLLKCHPFAKGGFDPA